MSRHRESIPPPIIASATATAAERFNLRWHTIVNPDTSSADIMSSPDPLNENETTIAIPPSSQRVTRSQQRPPRHSSRAGSPRKQTFELEVGNNRSPQRLLVTVETEDGQGVSSPAGATRRRLFPGSPSPFPASRRAGAMTTTTTTTVPLKDSIEDEDAIGRLDLEATPRRRGRPRKTNGTPIPTATKKRKAGTPIKRPTPRRQNTSHLPDPLSDPIGQPSPSPRKRGRPPKNASLEPSGGAGLSSASKPNKSQAGRRRRQALAPDELIDLAPQPHVIEETLPDEDDMDLVGVPTEPANMEADAGTLEETAPSPPPEADSDIWMATASPEATPRPQSDLSKSISRPPAPEEARRSPSADLASLPSDAGDYGADVLSIDDASETELPSDAVPARRDDTIAQGEDFSMIFMDSIQSFQAFKSSMQSATHEPPPAHEEDFGEETSFIINQTLESVRRRNATEMEQDDDPTEQAMAIPESLETLEEPYETRADRAYVSPEQAAVEDEREEFEESDHQPIDTMQVSEQHEQGQEEEQKEDQSYEETGGELTPAVSLGAIGEEDPLTSEDTSPVISPMLASAKLSAAKLLSSRWLRSPRKADVSPLRQRLAQSQFRHADSGVGTTETIVDRASSRLLSSPARRRPSAGLAEPNYDDSFSEIPQDVLAAATPRRPATQIDLTEEPDDADENMEEADDEDEVEQAQLIEAGEEAGQEEQEEEEGEGEAHLPLSGGSLHQTNASNASSTTQTDRGRLPTPDDTPPNIEDPMEESPEKSSAVSVSIGSSPPKPRAQPEAEQEPQSSIAGQSDPVEMEVEVQAMTSATPLNQVSSPAQEPQPQSVGEEPVQQRQGQDKAVRPALSAIVRAGRALQTITSDPPSPESHQYQLRSPFQSSASKDPGGFGTGSRGAHATGRRISLSPARQPPIRHHRQTASLDRLDRDDPFGSMSRGRGQTSFIEALNRSIHESTRVSSPGSTVSSMRITPPNEKMSWIEAEGPIGPELRGDNSLQDVVRASTASATPVIQSHGHQLPAADEQAERESEPADQQQDDERPEDDAQEELIRGDDETDIWEIEAERSHLQASTQQPPAENPPPLHQRGQIPSPWMRTADAGPSGNEVGKEASSPVPGFEEYSLLEQRRTDQENQNNSSGQKANRFDLSSFFSSPNAIPGAAVGNPLPRSTSIAPRAANTTAGAQAGPSIQTSSMFPSVPQKEFRPRRNSRSSQFSPAKPKEAASQPSPGRSASPETPERLQMPVVAQKQNFTPRQRQTNESVKPASATAVAPTPPRMQLSHADIQRWQRDTSDASDDSSRRIRPLLRPLPPPHASPRKSNLRSPLKPHTPGRVVEFASSVLSPAEQARIRAERRSSIGSGFDNDDGSAPEASGALVPDHDKENQDSDVSMTDASPQSASQPAKEEPLSQTVWSRRHWALLESILQHRLEHAFDFDFPRRADRYLGKTVRNSHDGGGAMVLERWHLDCIDAFRDIVGGWNEGVLAMRLFSLIMAAEKRKRPQNSTVPQRRKGGVMFH